MFAVVPFDPATTWGERRAFKVVGAINGTPWRGDLEQVGGEWVLALGPTWRRDAGIEAGETVEVALQLEGLQRDDLAPDLAGALAAHAEAAAFFDGLSQFYRKGYVSWIEATKRRPELRAARIAEAIDHLAAGRKERRR